MQNLWGAIYRVRRALLANHPNACNRAAVMVIGRQGLLDTINRPLQHIPFLLYWCNFAKTELTFGSTPKLSTPTGQ
jgi:hypothetical protein